MNRSKDDIERMLRLSNFTIERTQIPIVWVDSNARLFTVNKAAIDCFGYPAETFCDLIAEDIAPDIPLGVWPEHWAKLKREGSRTFSSSFRKSSGERFEVEVQENFIEFEGTEYSCSFIWDMTEQLRTQKSLTDALKEVQKLKDRLDAENVYLKSEIKLSHNFDEIITGSGGMLKTLHQVEQVAPTDASVLIVGETGVGKELVARAIHQLSNRRNRPLIRLNCAALPAALIENELFGHEKGAFTGADARMVGRFELADGGTLFLDEIGDLPPELQTRLLRVLQEGEFERLGSTRTIKVNVRILAATHVDLPALIQAGGFRSDLYYRLNVFPIYCPPLRERKEDIPLLVEHFVRIFSQKNGKRINVIPGPVMESLKNYPWPGNIRELENVIERAVIVSQGDRLEVDASLSAQGEAPGSHIPSRDEAERAHIMRALSLTSWRVGGRQGAASLLGMKRTTLQARMAKLGIHRQAPSGCEA